jgi:hypothetical protein
MSRLSRAANDKSEEAAFENVPIANIEVSPKDTNKVDCCENAIEEVVCDSCGIEEVVCDSCGIELATKECHPQSRRYVCGYCFCLLSCGDDLQVEDLQVEEIIDSKEVQASTPPEKKARTQ